MPAGLVTRRLKRTLLARMRKPLSSSLVDDVQGARALKHLTGRFHFEVPLGQICWTGAFRYGEWHPWVRALQHGRHELARYYEGFLPETVGQRYLLDSTERGLERRPVEPPPWWRRRQTDARGQVSYNYREAQKYCGPIDPDKLDEEWNRLLAIKASIERNGYDPQGHEGHIKGFFMLADGEEIFQITAGQHRLAALAAAGWDTIPVTFQPTYPRTVALADVEWFPGVLSGDYSAEAAALLFRQHFRLDGSQQYAAIDGAHPDQSGRAHSAATS